MCLTVSSTIHETDDDCACENSHARNYRLAVLLPGIVFVSRIADQTDSSIATAPSTQTLPQPPSPVSDQRTLVMVADFDDTTVSRSVDDINNTNAAKARML